jgi:hypothetical protein
MTRALTRNLRFVLFGGIIFYSSLSLGDTISRINDCEHSRGANGCVYDILREIATASNGVPDNFITYCQCDSAAAGTASRLNAYVENLTRGTVVTHSLVYYDNDRDGRKCRSALPTHPRCQ